MTFNLNQFKSKLNQFGGPAKNSLFVVEFYDTNSDYVGNRELSFFCQTVTVPGINIATTEYNPRNFGMSESIPTGMTHTQFNAVFICDSQHRIVSFFHEWLRNVLNYEDSGDFANPRNSEQLPYEINYKSDYAVNAAVKQYSTDASEFNPKFYTCELTGVYPTDVSLSTFSWDSSDYTTLSVNFSYSSIKFKNQLPKNIERSSETPGTRLIDYYTSIGSVSDTLQDRVDRLSDNIRPFRILG